MTRIPTKTKRIVIEQFCAGISTELLAERLRVGLWQIEAVLREALKKT